MARRNESEKDFPLKAAVRAILWAQGYSTRVDVLLAYNRDPKGKSVSGKAGLTDLDVFGIRLDPGFRVHTVVADCKTTTGQVPERLFWLAGVSKFFGSDANLLVRSQQVPEHAPPLARSLDITLIGPDDLTVLTNIYINSIEEMSSKVWQDFLSPELLGEVLSRLSRLPDSLASVDRYRETGYWMEEPYRQIQKVILALQLLAKESGAGPTFRLIFADFVWLYTLTLWRTCERLNANGFARLEKELELYISGEEAGRRYLQQAKQAFELLARQTHDNITLPILPYYFDELLELVGRCVRRPYAVAKIARRAEWLVIGQMVGDLGKPPWEADDDDLICNKLLGDIAQFLARASKLKPTFIEEYLRLLHASYEQRSASDNSTNMAKASNGERDVPEILLSESNLQTPSLVENGSSSLENDAEAHKPSRQEAPDQNNHALEGRGKYEGVGILYHHAAIREQHLGKEHLNAATDLNKQAALYRRQGRYGEAEPLLQRALAIREQLLGPEHLNTVTSLNNLATLYRSQDKYGEAEPLLQRALTIQERRLGPEHPGIAISLNNLAALYRSQGRYIEAEPLLQRALTIQERQLGPEHPGIAISLNNLAALYRSQGKYIEAEPLLQRALTIQERQLGPEHPHTQTVRGDYTRLLQAIGRDREANLLEEDNAASDNSTSLDESTS